MSDWFVGFRPSPKSPDGLVRFQHTAEATTDVPVATLFTLLTTREGIDQILDETVRFDARPGGKLRFLSAGDEGYGGTYARIQVPKRVIVMTELHGELDVRLSERRNHSAVSIRATRLSAPAEEEPWRSRIDQVLRRLITPEAGDQ